MADGEPAAMESETKCNSAPSELSPNGVDITKSQDGGVLKEIKKEGSGDEHPLDGNKVIVHYTGTLPDGSKFDSSRDRGEKFTFDLGKGNVIKAWDEGVATMKRGEVAVLTCRSDYAYGPSGHPPKIPPDATLIFEVELFDWKGEDLSTDKDESIIRSILQKGEGYNKPNEGATVKVHITGKYNSEIIEDRDVEFVLGEGYEQGVIEGVETALTKFLKGERSRLNIKAAVAFGKEGCPEKKVPANADVVYEVELKEFEKAKESWEMDTEEKLSQSEIVKGKGTNLFKAGKFKQAVKYYQKVVDYLEYETSLEGDDADKRRALMLAAHLNMAQCQLKLQDNVAACEQCDKALELDSDNEKGHFRRGQAHLNKKDYEDAIADFKAVLAVDPSNKAARNQITIASQKIKQDKEKEKKTYAGMFQKFADIDSKKEKENPVAKENEKNADNSMDEDSGSGSDAMESETAPSEEVNA